MMDIFYTLLSQIHVLIGGRTGGGKSVLLNGIIYTALIQPPDRTKFVLIDPKRVELYQYRAAPHCLLYASEPGEMLAALQTVVNIMDDRYKTMQYFGAKSSTECHIYIMIDEMADLLDVCGKPAQKALKRLLQLGRAANIHVIACTQHVNRLTLPAALQINFTSIVALPQRSAIESRQLIGCKGAETLDTGTAYYITPQHTAPQLVKIPYIRDGDIIQAIHLYDTDHGGQTAKKTDKRGILQKLIDSILFA